MTTSEKTFTSFTPEQAAQYASGRGSSYPSELYKTLLDYHQGEKNLHLDIGCGPGKCVFDLISHFKYGVGTDSSAGMIEQATKDAAKYALTDRTQFHVQVGEECDKALVNSAQSTADVITVAMAAHWMDMPAFYKAAEKVLQPGGTLAMWTCSSLYVHPSTPNAAQLQDALSDLEDGMLADYRDAGHVMTRTAYRNLPSPWTIEAFESSFEQSSFTRKDWDVDGVPSAPPQSDGSAGPFLMHMIERLDDLERGLSSASLVIKWRAANAEKAHTEEDPVKLTMKRLRERSGGMESLNISASLSLLLMRKANETPESRMFDVAS